MQAQDNRSNAEQQAWEHFAQYDGFRYRQIYDTIERIVVWSRRIYNLTGFSGLKAIMTTAQRELDKMICPYDELDDTEFPENQS